MSIPESSAPTVGEFTHKHFEASWPHIQGGVEVGTHQVVIVGGGPVGMAVALGLANFGIRSVVVESDDSVCIGSRAACISRRSLQIIERLGALPAFLAKGLPWAIGRSFYGDTEVFRFEMKSEAADQLPPMVNLQQYYIEQYLFDEINRRNAVRPGMIEVRWASEVTGFEQHDKGVTLQVANALGQYGLRADWAVACDGGQSFMRKHLGLELEGTAYDGRYVIIDIELHSTHPTERRAWFDPPWNKGSTVLMHRQPDNVWRIDYQLRHGDSAEDALRPERLHEFVQRHLDAIGEGHLPWRPVWTSIYRAGAMTLADYRHGHLLFAGNAAHAMPIFGVRGLNSGFDDADNLAWKLASVVNGASPASLLDSYSSERIEAFHNNAANAMRSTEFMSPPSRGFDLMREAALSLAETQPGIANLVNPRQTQAVRYERSPLSSISDEFACGPQPGEILIDGRTEGIAQSLHKALRPGFNALIFEADTDTDNDTDTDTDEDLMPGESISPANADLNVIRIRSERPSEDGLIDAEGAIARAYGAEGGAVYLLRPDGHVAGRWKRFKGEVLHGALSRARGHAVGNGENR